jgi:hypothetical protein
MNISELNFVNMQDVYRTCKEWFSSYSLNGNEQQRKTAESIKRNVSKCNLLSKSKIKPRLRREIHGSRKKSVLAYRGIK